MLIFGHFSNFLLIFEFYFWQISPPPSEYVSKNDLNYSLVHTSAKYSLKSAKNVVFPSYCILVNRSMDGGRGGGALPRPLPWLRSDCCRKNECNIKHKYNYCNCLNDARKMRSALNQFFTQRHEEKIWHF